MEHSRIYDLLIVTDATASMSTYLRALNDSLPEIIRISALTGCFSRIGVVAYRDYCAGELTEWSGWHGLDGNANSGPATATTTRQELLDFAKRLKPDYGGDWPEAAKTGLAVAHANMRRDAETIVLLYADAPPHSAATGGSNRNKEKKALTRKENCERYGVDATRFVDWVHLTTLLQGGHKKARVFSVVQSHLVDTLSPFTYLSTRTGGACFEIRAACGSDVISKLTLGILLTWMGVEKEGTKATAAATLGKICQYINEANIATPRAEDDNAMSTYWVMKDKPDIVKLVSDNLCKTDVSVAALKQYISARNPAMTDFSKRYLADQTYRTLVVDNLQDIIQTNVAAVTVNPVFGSLWRTVCSDRLNEARDRLIELFGRQVDAIVDANKKKQLKDWLEESYDYVGEILEAIAAVPAEEQFPCVYLDPTLDFSGSTAAAEQPVAVKDEANEADEDGPVTGDASAPNGFTRADLLEIGRSCDAKILRRLGRILTRLTYVESEAELPAHIRNKDAVPVGEAGHVPRIPLALANDAHQRKFWKILLHTVLPGTKLGLRPAALLAALSLRMGMAPLRTAADAELLYFRDKWNMFDIPETWNTNCLGLLLAADKDYEARVTSGATQRPAEAAAVLTAGDRRLFAALVDYKLAEMNLGTTLTARVGWTPDKTKSALGPTALCRVCRFPRSVTIMAADGVCGLCAEGACECATPDDHNAMVTANVSAADDVQTTRLWWVECGVRACRAQYVVYNPLKLRVRPKCHYCRIANRAADDHSMPTTAPYVECGNCLSRVIWPAEYRTAATGYDVDKPYTCPACFSGNVPTIVDVPTSAGALAAENGRDWLLRNDGQKIAEPFAGRSLFYTASTAGIDGFADAVEVLPEPKDGEKPLQLTLKAKLVRNTPDVLAELARWVASRRTEGDTCSLCFSTLSKRALRPACGRRGCVQRVCVNCARDWYGLNARGKILNVAALGCPFCRRRPAPGAVAGVAPGLNYLSNLREAVEAAGQWIYAWCWDCGEAKPFCERVCARGAPDEVARWACEGCRTARAARDDAKAPLTTIKNCPGCQTPTEKLSGCDHIACMVPGCGAHWCFNCGVDVPQAEIYEHMSSAHGGWYGGREDPADDEDEEYD